MLVFLLLALVLNTTLSVPITAPNDSDPVALFGRERPPCMDIGSYRTKSNIIWSCLATIFACTWVAIHPNVPDQRHSEWQKLRIRICTMIYALMGPEFVTMWALRQRVGAAKHVAKYNQKFFPGSTPKSWVECIESWFRKPECRTDVPWTLTHGFLLEMHGLYLHNDEELLDGYELNNVDKLDEPVVVLEKEINDKSKGDFLTKLIVVLQTTWFVVQCLARWVTHLPVTELEVVTLAFAVLNIVTYILWWNKPQSMHVPIRLRKDLQVEFRQNRQELPKPASAEATNEAKIPGANPTHGRNPGFCNLLCCVSRCVLGALRCTKQWISRTVEDMVSFGRMVVRGIRYCGFSAGTLLDSVVEANVKNRDACTKSVIVVLLLFFTPFIAMIDAEDGDDDFVFTGIQGAFYSTESGFYRPKIVTTTFVVSLIFGGLHLIPVWTMTFQSLVERHLWQMSSFCMVVAPLLLLLARFISVKRLSPIFRVCIGTVSALSVLLYMIARIILLTISFTTLRDLPQDAYRTIDWVTLFPHL